jgi:plastocyanin
MNRRIVTALAVVLLLASGCARMPSGPLKYAVDLDAKSDAKEKFQFSAFFPGSLVVTPGDSIKFRNRSTEAPHTVTFGVPANRSNQPPILTDKGENPVVFGKCSSKDAPTTKLVKCSNTRLPAFDGTGYWNSGVLQPKPAPKSAGAKSITIKIARDAKIGRYSFVCILHPLMNGTLRIVSDERGRSTPADVRKDGREAAKDARADAEALDVPEEEKDGEEVVVTAGYGDKITAVNLFAPSKIEVDEGTTVRWKIGSPYEPHTVTFDSTFEVGDARGFGPGGVASESDYDGGFANSGIIGPEGSPFEGDFALTFTKAGTYRYVCLLHPGQTGSVVVS